MLRTFPPPLGIISTFSPQNSPSLLRQCLTAGTAACFADLVTFPLDTVKVRQQVQGQVMTTGAGAGELPEYPGHRRQY